MADILPIDAQGSSDLPPPRMSEIVIRTTDLDALRDWYQLVLSAKRTLEYDVEGNKAFSDDPTVNFHRLCFLRVYWEFPYSEVLAIFEIPGLERAEHSLGLHHMQFRCASLDNLVERYERLLSYGIAPYRSHNHGPSISFYYQDPDENLVELSGPNFETEAEYGGFFASVAFADNPAGVPIEAAEFVQALRSGVDRADLVRLPS